MRQRTPANNKQKREWTNRKSRARRRRTRKYALNGLFAIDNTNDADSINNTETTAPTKATKQAANKPTTTKPETKYFCNDCGEEITEYKARKKTFTPEMIAKASVNKYGRAVCIKCANAIEAAAKAEAETN